MAEMPRIQAVVIPLLRDALVPEKAAKVGSWVENIDFREFPLINVRRIGGTRHETRPTQLSKPVIELTAYHQAGLIECEELYEDALEVLYNAVKNQTQTEAGYLHSIKETMGATQFSSPFMDSWRVQGLIALGLRPPRK
ncbi:tail terminator [Mycobacterium phage Pistachio]|uniref:Tail terminator n=3 Tax=Veracruzvirus TaxID=2948946 RepID=A0A8F3E4B7_9CAUD|nr:tail terminator [Mycobacterium phage HelDan]YP_010060557.1 tail terminator [Mycobacterium phage Pistachio]AQT28422.1 tail terminator [Mycobacterium phage Idleandcovert]AVR57006.1 tail terminator [Mycobacterium phage Puppy]AVR77432.1 tail terminator [Mycobacterium phage TNguyen7]QWY79562.1 tail terminator [Mycobacterium phage Scout]WAB10208.1 tail terminator [Mycobacterium phage BlueBird]